MKNRLTLSLFVVFAAAGFSIQAAPTLFDGGVKKVVLNSGNATWEVMRGSNLPTRQAASEQQGLVNSSLVLALTHGLLATGLIKPENSKVAQYIADFVVNTVDVIYNGEYKNSSLLLARAKGIAFHHLAAFGLNAAQKEINKSGIGGNFKFSKGN